MIETDLHAPVKAYFEAQGFDVQAEVKNCDLVATSEAGDLIVIELKTGINLPLLVQATARQSITPHVYIAVPQKSYRRKQWQGIQRVVKQLGLGLLVVATTPLTTTVSEHFAPTEMRRTTKRKRTAVLNEVQQRISSYNTGGTSRGEIMTAYKQNAILIACFLEHLGQSSAADLKKLGMPNNTRSILADNHYGWFKRVERGIYALDDGAAAGPEKYPDLWQTGRNLVTERLKLG